MALPIDLDPNRHEIGFGGDVEQQCIHGTYPECRFMLERHLQREVERQHMKEEEAVKRMRDADDLWKKYKKDPEVKAKLKERARVRAEYEEGILVAAAARISEFRGHGIELQVIDTFEQDDSDDEEDEKKGSKSDK